MYSQSHLTNKVFLFFCQKVYFVLNSEQNLNNKKKQSGGLELYKFYKQDNKDLIFFIFKTLFCFSHVQNLKKRRQVPLLSGLRYKFDISFDLEKVKHYSNF